MTCECCGNEKKRVWGFVNKSGDAHAVYYALLNVTEDHPRLGLTLSIGPWWDGTEPSQRSWCHIDIRTQPDKYDFQIKDPKESNFYPWERGGRPLTPEQASGNGLTDEIQSVSKFIAKQIRRFHLIWMKPRSTQLGVNPERLMIRNTVVEASL